MTRLNSPKVKKTNGNASTFTRGRRSNCNPAKIDPAIQIVEIPPVITSPGTPCETIDKAKL